MSAPEKGAVNALIYSAAPPDEGQRQRFEAWLSRKYGGEVSLCWREEPELKTGFRLRVGSEVYDWSPEGRLQQLKDEAAQAAADHLHGSPVDNTKPGTKKNMACQVFSLVI